MSFVKGTLLLLLLLTLGPLPMMAQDSTKTAPGFHRGAPFVDKNGDGYNDNAPDHDGDGIPNGLDPDWQKLQKAQKKGRKQRFIDLDGDGINDLLFSKEGARSKTQKRRGKGHGLNKPQTQGQKRHRMHGR